MEKEHYQLMIRFLFLERLDAAYGDASPSMATVKNWFNEFQRSRTSVFNEPSPGVPKTANTEDKVTKIHDLVLAIEGARDSRGSRNLKKPRGSYPT
ncbi:uncharacterized protein FLJ37770 [Trichonephila clavipes]|nr:uncharacterized protein FLJ37770 [Trichonephila clavipes]